jgi:hypothetical protein
MEDYEEAVEKTITYTLMLSLILKSFIERMDLLLATSVLPRQRHLMTWT